MLGIPKKLRTFRPELFDSIVPQNAEIRTVIKGSDVRHISTSQYYRDLYAQNEELKEDIEYLQDQKQEVYASVRDLYDRKDGG